MLDALDEATAAALVTEVRGECRAVHVPPRPHPHDALRGAERDAPARLHQRVGKRSRRSSAGRRGAHRGAGLPLARGDAGRRRRQGDRLRAPGGRAGARQPRLRGGGGALRARARRARAARSRTASGCGATCCSPSATRSAGRATRRYRETVANAVDGGARARRRRAPRPRGARERPPRRVHGERQRRRRRTDRALREASAALGDADSLLRARVLGQLAVELVYTPDRERRDALTREAVAMARRLGDRTGLAQVLDPAPPRHERPVHARRAARAHRRAGGAGGARSAAASSHGMPRSIARARSSNRATSAARSAPSRGSSGSRASCGNPSSRGVPAWDGRCSP